jgi:SHS2 domain-containing protein
MEKYRFFDEMTSDVIFEAYGETLKDVFANAAEAMFHFICKLDQVQPTQEKKIEVQGTSPDDLMINWLQALIAAVDIEAMFFSKFTITDITDTKLTAFVYGEPVTPEKGETVVKAVTLHQYKFEKTPEGYMCRVSLDI